MHTPFEHLKVPLGHRPLMRMKKEKKYEKNMRDMLIKKINLIFFAQSQT